MQTSTPDPRQTAGASRLRHERRSDSSSIPVRIPLRTGIAGRRLKGSEISLEAFVLDDYIEEIGIGESGWYDLDLEQGDWVLTVRVQAALTARSRQKRTSTFEILETSEADREVLRRVLRCHLTGEKLSLTDFADQRSLRAADDEAGSERRPLGRSLGLICFGAGGVAMVGLLGLSIFEQTMTTKARFATVTAPMVELRAPSSGQISLPDLVQGAPVVQNQRLAAIADNDLRAELALARATFDYTDQLIDNLQDHLQNAAITTVSRGAGSAAAVEVRLDELRSSLDLEQAKIAALEARSLGNTIHAPCNCLVWWTRGTAGQEWVRKGEKILTLVQPDPQALMVEALVHLSEVEGLARGQQALVELPGQAEPVPARIQTIVLESERQPRAGFPDWLRQDQSLASVLLVAERPLSPDLIGMPARVTFSGLSPAWLMASFDDQVSDPWAIIGKEPHAPEATGVGGPPPDGHDLVLSIPSNAAARKVWPDDQR